MLMPALLTRMSSRPSFAAASSTMPRHARSSLTSAAMAMAPSCFTAAAFFLASRPAIATLAPARASPCAMPRPMPPLPPVTSAAFPVRSKIFIMMPAIMDYLTKASISAHHRRMPHVDAVRRFNRFYTRRIGVLHSSYLGSPFPLPQARVLYEIGRRGECTASELGADLDIDLGYLSRLLQGLKRERLVQGEPARHDARHIRLSLTPKGRKAFALLDETSRRTMGEMLSPLRRGERERLVAAMQMVETALEPRAPKSEITLRGHRAGDKGWVVER